MQYRYDDDAIRSAFQSVLRRDPTGSELRRYEAFMEEYNWTESDIRRDLQDRPDYQRYSTTTPMTSPPTTFVMIEPAPPTTSAPQPPVTKPVASPTSVAPSA